jgi:hypothetical protein
MINWLRQNGIAVAYVEMVVLVMCDGHHSDSEEKNGIRCRRLIVGDRVYHDPAYKDFEWCKGEAKRSKRNFVITSPCIECREEQKKQNSRLVRAG